MIFYCVNFFIKQEVRVKIYYRYCVGSTCSLVKKTFLSCLPLVEKTLICPLKD